MQDAVRVLIAEDDALVGEMIRGLLETLGCEVLDVAEDGRQVLDLLPALSPDVVLMDIDMPVMDGITAAARIRDSHPVPVVMLTAYETPDLVTQASAAGVGAYLVKPPNSRDLERAITIAMARFADMVALQRLNAELDAYAHTVAHDLKNPLSSVIGFAEVLAEEGTTMSSDDLQRYLNLVAQTGHKMTNIIDELLLLASVRKRSEVPTDPLAMAPVVSTACRRLCDLIARTEADISVPDAWPLALGYAPWIEEVWVNYISNAMKYGGQPPRVVLGFDRSLPIDAAGQPLVRFWAADNGPGIAADACARLFQPFERLTQARATGHGLGLSIVRRIVERLGGTVGIESPPASPVPGFPEAGSLFWFTLPLSDPEMAGRALG